MYTGKSAKIFANSDYFKGGVRYFFFHFEKKKIILIYDVLRLFCENLKSIGVKLTEIWSFKSEPLRSDFELQRTFKAGACFIGSKKSKKKFIHKSTVNIFKNMPTKFYRPIRDISA